MVEFFFHINNFPCHVWPRQQGENMAKGPTNIKVKVLFQGLHMTCVIFVLVYNFKFLISNIAFNITF